MITFLCVGQLWFVSRFVLFNICEHAHRFLLLCIHNSEKINDDDQLLKCPLIYQYIASYVTSKFTETAGFLFWFDLCARVTRIDRCADDVGECKGPTYDTAGVVYMNQSRAGGLSAPVFRDLF